MQFSDALALARRRWIIIGICAVIGAGLGALRTDQAATAYLGTTQIFVSGNDTTNKQEFEAGQLAAQRVGTYAQLVKNPELLNRVADRDDVEESADELVARLSAQSEPGTVILEVTANGRSTEAAEALSESTAAELSGLIEELETPRGAEPRISAAVVGPASANTMPTATTGVRVVGLGAVLGLLFGFGIALVWDLSVASRRRPTTAS